MNKIFLTLVLAFGLFMDLNAQVEYKIITSVESIVPNGLGRSRLISASEERDYKEFTSERSEEDSYNFV